MRRILKSLNRYDRLPISTLISNVEPYLTTYEGSPGLRLDPASYKAHLLRIKPRSNVCYSGARYIIQQFVLVTFLIDC